MKPLSPIVELLDRFLSPELRRMEARDRIRVRFLVFALIFVLPIHFIRSLLHWTHRADDIWIVIALVNLVVSSGLLWQFHRARDYHRPATLTVCWMHGLCFLSFAAMPGVYSLSNLWSPCLIVISSLIFGRRGALLSTLALTTVSVTHLFHHFSQGTPWVTLELDDHLEQMLVQLAGSTLLMAVVVGVYEFLREAYDTQRARQLLLAARHAHEGAVGELVGHVAHEVNNPLAILQGSVTRLRRQLERNEWSHEARKLLTHMQRSHERIIRVQQSLAVFASGNQNEPFVSSEVHLIIKDVQLAMKPQAHAQQVQLEFKQRSRAIDLRCQRHQLVYVLCCLIQNALDACRDHPKPQILVEAYEDRNMLCIAVSDNGKGIESPLQERVFQPFFTTKTGGTAQGLSLSVCRGILVKHGGGIQFQSQPGATTFTMQLPKEPGIGVKLRKGA